MLMDCEQRSELRRCMEEAIYAIVSDLKSRGIAIPDELKQRDRKEPERKAKEEMEAKLFRLFRKRFASQARAIRSQLEATHPGRKAIGLPTDPEFNEEEFQADVMRVVLKGVTSGAEQFGKEISIGMDYTLVNSRAAEWVRNYTFDLVKGIDKLSVDVFQSAISDFIQTPGMTIGDVMDRLPFGESRALTVATTETTRAYAQGQRLAGEQLKDEHPGVLVVKNWYTNSDDRVCDICGPLDGLSVPLEENFESGGESIDEPPAHVGCRCWMSTSTRLVENE
jgi:hypothetical protein